MSVFLLFQQTYDYCNNWETVIRVFKSEFAAMLAKEEWEQKFPPDDTFLNYFIREWEVEGEK